MGQAVVLSDIGKNAIRLKRLLAMGAVWPELVEEMSNEQERLQAPDFLCFFQLPFPIFISRDWHTVPGSREDRSLRLSYQARLGRLKVDEFARFSVTPAYNNNTEGLLFTQMIALVP